jgi:multidrug resistance efflux pump
MSSSSCPASTTPTTSRVWIGLACAAALVAGGGLTWWMEGRGDRQFAGYLEVRSTQICATRSGLVTRRLAAEGMEVTLRKPIVELSDPILEEKIEDQTEIVASLEETLKQAVAQAEVEFDWREKELHAQICDARLKSADFLKEKFNHELRKNMLADVLATNETALWDDNDPFYRSIILEPRMPEMERINTALRLETASNAADVSAAQVEICDRQIQQLQKVTNDLPARIRRKVGVDASEANLARAKETLTRLTARREQLTIVSPAIGRVGVYRVSEGDRVEPGMPIVELLDNAKRFLKVEVPSTSIADFTIQRNVRLTFPGNVACEGRIYSIAPQASPRADGSMSDPVIIAYVEPAGLPWPELPVGARVGVQLSR